MSVCQARALYDFAGEQNTAELTITAGETLTVTRKDVGEGWWEGCNIRGQTGLFPAAYVEEIKSPVAAGPPSVPAPVLTPQQQQADDDWGTDSGNNQQSNQDGDGWDDEWDDDVYSEIPQQSQQNEQIYANEGNQEYPVPLPQLNRNKLEDSDNMSVGGVDNRGGTVTKKNLNRFSSFVKSGGESYILGLLKILVSDADKIYIRQLDDGYFWDPIKQPYTVSVASPKKESKLKGLKSFIAYQLTPSFNNIQVSRRYKHFDWLHERLTEKYCLIPIPPLPDKQISGRYEEQFIEHRRVQLQEFVNWVCRHPVLSISSVFQHFLTCTDEKRWKAGKRSAEKDVLSGANYCNAIVAPERNLQQSYIDQQIDTSSNFIHSLDLAVKNLMITAQDQSKKHQGPYKQVYTKVGDSFASLGAALELDEGVTPSKLTNAIKRTGVAYITIAKIFEDQPKYDWEPLADKLHIYKGITSAFPDVLAVHRGTMLKRKECEKLTSEHKMDMVQLIDVQKRTDVVSYGVLAEINHFRSERAVDLKSAMKGYLQEQITFYQKIVEQLQQTLEYFDA